MNDNSRTFKPWSHIVSLAYAQLAHSTGLNDVCDALGNHSTALQTIRGATAPSKNGLSNANRTRDPKMAEDLFWSTIKHLTAISSGFGKLGFNVMPKRFKRTIHAVDSSTIKLLANCMDWAKHRGNKAAAKLHLSLDLQSFLPKVAIVDTAAESDPKRAREICADIRKGEIAIFDKAYIDFLHLHDLDKREVSWVTRAKENMSFIVLSSKLSSNTNIISDQEVLLDQKTSNENYPSSMRRIEAWVEVDGKCRTMVFITNNVDWAASSICDLYKSRWSIEVFFKQIKQTLQLCDFLGHNANAVRWQIWTALLVYVLMRFLAHQSKWDHSFTRLFTLIRGVLWDKYCLNALLKSCGIAGCDFRSLAGPDQLYLPGFAYR